MIDDLNPDAVLAAAKDTILRAAGVDVRDPHPLALQLTAAEAARACARKHAIPGSSFPIALGSGITTSTYQRLLSESLHVLVSRAYVAQAQHSVFAPPIAVPKIGEPVEVLGGIDSMVQMAPVSELAEIQRFRGPAPFPGIPAVQISTVGVIIPVSRKAIINDDLRSVAKAVASAGASTARTEAIYVAQAFEANPVMDDGIALFDVSRNNIELGGPDEDGALSEITLGSALAKLRKQVLPNGTRSDLAGRFLVVCADLELKARQVVSDAGIDLQVVPMADLPDARWYLLADPMIQPTIGVLRLPGVKDPTRVEPAPKDARLHVDGTAVRVMADLGASLLSAVGIVRGGTVA